MKPNQIEVNGQIVKFKKIRTSAKGVPVHGARIHLAGIGTCYIQVYEEQVKMIAEHTLSSREKNPSFPRRATNSTNEKVLDVMRMVVQRLELLESALTAPPTPIPPPPPSH